MKSVVISGSVRYVKEIMEWVKALKTAGVKVYHPKDLKFSNLSKEDLDYAVTGATFGYFYKIQKADVVLLFNKDKYAGVSTTLELGYATALGKPIVSLEEDEDVRRVLIEEQVKTPDELITYLKR